MNYFKLAAAMMITGIFLPGIGFGETQADVNRLIEKVDSLYRANNSYARMQMTIVNPNWQRTLVLDVWSLGMKKTFIRILSPAKDKGVATLRMATEMWNYFPKIDKVMKVPPSMMMGAWMGSDFTNDDLVKETTLLDDYTAELIRPEAADQTVYSIQLVPKQQTATVWAKIILNIDKQSLLPKSEAYYDEKGQKMRRIDYREVKEMGGRKMPTIMELVPLNKPGNKTVIEYQKAEFDTGVPDSVFSLRNLQQR
jgi:outer membrane lipoprotein-sorting protein